MKILILSRARAEGFSNKYLAEPYAIISITDRAVNDAVFNENSALKAVLRLKFNDADGLTENAISSVDAKRIIDFVQSWKECIRLIVVHCEAGMSRSAGVGAALMLWLNGDDSPVFNNAYFRPNMRCYRTMLNELERGGLLKC